MSISSPAINQGRSGDPGTDRVEVDHPVQGVHRPDPSLPRHQDASHGLRRPSRMSLLS